MNRYCFPISLVLLLLTYSLHLCAQSEAQAVDSSMVWVEVADQNFSITHPQTWQYDHSGFMNSEFIILSPTTEQSDDFRENINLMVEPLAVPNLSLEDYTALAKDQINAVLSSVTLLQEEDVLMNNRSYKKIVFSGQQGKYTLQFAQYYTLLNQTAYILTFTSTKEQFARYQNMAAQIIHTFQLSEEKEEEHHPTAPHAH